MAGKFGRYQHPNLECVFLKKKTKHNKKHVYFPTPPNKHDSPNSLPSMIGARGEITYQNKSHHSGELGPDHKWQASFFDQNVILYQMTLSTHRPFFKYLKCFEDF